jgi:hypothetical protein
MGFGNLGTWASEVHDLLMLAVTVRRTNGRDLRYVARSCGDVVLRLPCQLEETLPPKIMFETSARARPQLMYESRSHHNGKHSSTILETHKAHTAIINTAASSVTTNLPGSGVWFEVDSDGTVSTLGFTRATTIDSLAVNETEYRQAIFSRAD